MFEADDIFIVEREFSDTVPLLENEGFVVKLTAFCESGQSELDTLSVNKSRLVNKCRFVVESRNGHVILCFFRL